MFEVCLNKKDKRNVLPKGVELLYKCLKWKDFATFEEAEDYMYRLGRDLAKDVDSVATVHGDVDDFAVGDSSYEIRHLRT